jgi:integrase
MGTKITLRQKPISGNRASLYLDFYPAILPPGASKTTRRQFLGKYVHTPIKFLKRKDKQIPVYDLNPGINESYEVHNREAIKIAEQIRQQRQNKLDKPEIYDDFEKERLRITELGEQNFITYFKELADKRKASSHDNWVSAYNYINNFTNGYLKFTNLNERFCDDFKEHLLTTKSKKKTTSRLANNSAVSYFNKLKSALKQAFKDGYLQINLNEKIELIKTDETMKNTLTIDELNILAKSEYPNPILKKATLFSALTGLPFKEMQNLEWGNIEVSDKLGIRIKMIRQKTGKPYFVSISEQAYRLLGESMEPESKVFTGLNNRLRYTDFPNWLNHVVISKKLTFHDLRHTYGTNQVEAGTDVYTLKGNMGHSDVRYTQIYAHQSDLRKKEAAERVKLDM